MEMQATPRIQNRYRLNQMQQNKVKNKTEAYNPYLVDEGQNVIT